MFNATIFIILKAYVGMATDSELAAGQSDDHFFFPSFFFFF